jgi:hypothetical protein
LTERTAIADNLGERIFGESKQNIDLAFFWWINQKNFRKFDKKVAYLDDKSLEGYK